MIVDLRSDTVTKPSKEMLNAMLLAEVGDDVLGDDPTVIKLEEKAAKLFAQEAALFCPSGTMTNQIAIKVHTKAPGEVICSDLAHIYLYEGGGIAFNSGLSTRLIKSNRGRFTLEQLKDSINLDDIHFPPSQLVALENTCNKGGGCYWDIREIKRISEYCKEQNLPLHLDGARIYNALVASGISTQEMGKYFDSISLCLSKGLGAPVGSLLIGSKKFIKQAKRIRKILGGGMRQAGYLAAAGIYALDHNIQRLEIDHQNAIKIAKTLETKPYVESVTPVETNIVIFKLKDEFPLDQYITELKAKGIWVAAMGNQQIRMVSHLGIGEAEMDYLMSEIP
ncbi:MAG: aminotransferase class I/II-fold pyridoxal phosphate-dependent enzyme [Flavobacteriales bacterium]|nr:aminotransferase class I/II-fold pyridoxal phosphate-dependent enzyme [Flavobacteriales bacterium]